MLESGVPARQRFLPACPGSDPERGALLVHGHLDVVPADPAEWSVHPFSGAAQDGYDWGRGAVDTAHGSRLRSRSPAGSAATGSFRPATSCSRSSPTRRRAGALGAQWLDEPLRPERAARLLVGEEREDEVARRHDPVAAEPAGDRDHHRVHVLHVDRAAAPHVAVLHRTGEGVHRPLRRLGGHDVEVPVDEQRATLAVRAGQPAEDVAASGRAGVEHLHLVPDLGELPRDVLRRLPLPTVPSGSPVLVVSIAMSCEASSTTSSSAALVMGSSYHREEGPRTSAILAAHARRCRARSEWRNGRRASLRC